MTHVAVLGAGVIGVTTAWYLNQAGFKVTVIEQESSSAMQTSLANGGQISVSHATPWANPSTPFKALKWLLREDAPLLYRLRADKAQWQWAMQFLYQCSAQRTDANLVQMVRLGLYSRQALQALRQDIAISYKAQTRGIMHFYTSKSEFADAIAPTKRMQELGCERHLIDIDTAISLEPALYSIAHKLKGATYTSQDESGDAHIFTQQLAKYCEQNGVSFLYNTQIVSLNTTATNRTHIDSVTIRSVDTMSEGNNNPNNSSNNDSCNHIDNSNKAPRNNTTNADDIGNVDDINNIDPNAETFDADIYVVALGSYSPILTKPLGVKLPIFPAKGYSATYTINPRAPHLAPFVSLIDDEFKLVTSRLGDQLRVAGTAEFDRYNLALSPARCHAVTQRVTQLFPKGIIASSVKYWAGLRPMTPSNVPLIGRAHLGGVWHGNMRNNNKDMRNKSFDNLWLNTGHGTLGWTHACGSAKALTKLIAGDTPDVEFDFIAGSINSQ